MKKNQTGFSRIELLIVIVVIAMIAVVTVPNLRVSADTANEESAIEALRAIVVAQAIYQSTSSTGDFAQNGYVLARAGLLDNELGCPYPSTCVQKGYVFSMTATRRTASSETYFDVTAVPQVYGQSGTGMRSFYTNERGIISYTTTATAPTGTSATVRTPTTGIRLTNIFPNKFDFEGDGKADLMTYRPSTAIWYLQRSSRSGYFPVNSVQFGNPDDQFVPADYNGNGVTFLATYRDGTWAIMRGSGCCFDPFKTIQFGETGDIPVPANYDGDAKTDVAVFRPSTGTWYVHSEISDNSGVQFGQMGDKPVAGDYDGDGNADFAVFRPSTGIWYIRQSFLGFKAVQFGQADDKLVPADYDGDGRMDIAVYRPSNGAWYINQSTAGFKGFQFGVATDLPVPADYNGDGKADIAVFRDGIWYIQNSGTEQFRAAQFGQAGDKPAANAFVR